MNHSTFSNTLKEIALTAIAAMMVFSIAASQSANADTMDELIGFEQAITVVTKAESNYLASKNSFTKLEQQYSLHKVSLTELFNAQVTLNKAEQSVQLARTQLLISLSEIKKSNDTTLALNRSR